MWVHVHKFYVALQYVLDKNTVTQASVDNRHSDKQTSPAGVIVFRFNENWFHVNTIPCLSSPSPTLLLLLLLLD